MSDNIKQNYDAVFKDALSLFKDKSLDFLGLTSDTKITEILSTERKEIVVETEFSDLTFKTDKNYGIHLEEQVDITNKDLLRFLVYSVNLWKRHNMEFRTVIVTAKKTKISKLIGATVQFSPLIVDMSERDGDKLLEELKGKVSRGEVINELDLIFLPLCGSTKTKDEILRSGLELLPKVNPANVTRSKIGALMLMVSDKFIEKETFYELWEELKGMANLKILEVAEEKGIEEGKKITALEMLANGEPIDKIIKYTKLTYEQIEELKKSNSEISTDPLKSSVW